MLALRNKVSVYAQPPRKGEAAKLVLGRELSPPRFSPSLELDAPAGDLSQEAHVELGPCNGPLSREDTNCTTPPAKKPAVEKGAHVQITGSNQHTVARIEEKTQIQSNEYRYCAIAKKKKVPAVGRDRSKTPPSRPNVAANKVNLTAAEQFELELESMRGVQLLQKGDPKGEYY